ncbi:hypothetical protein ETI06_07850 [Macrococcoides goetzii]|nr:hypothetical protein [Macrococcus goetzii]TDM42254.1 hypothetical protein ETI10_03925 [Macrococcus goetzii]TDM47811.1 hypothetical protein ETI08_01375 [Macrococcus goetzii]TDM48933.1 hypothetical protein ETI06_07850 [Macrococcus goetzii]
MRQLLLFLCSLVVILASCENNQKEENKTVNTTQKQDIKSLPPVKSIKDFPLNFKVRSLSQKQTGNETQFIIKYRFTEQMAKYLSKEKPSLSYRLELPKSLYTVIGTNTNDQPFIIPTNKNGKINTNGTITFSFNAQTHPDLTKQYIRNDAIKLHVLNANQREFFTIADLGSNAEKYLVSK